ncbi:MAG: pilus assembly PilX N-terminal domain-containing protein [Parcubacteria group bacterium]|jgi:hypothetical protein
MKQKNKKIKNLKASALAYALIIMAVVMIILTSMLGYITSQLKFSANRAQKEEAFQIAEAGIYFYRWYLAHQTAGKTAREVDDFWQNGSPLGVDLPYEKTFSDPEGGVIGSYSIEAERPISGSTIVIVKSTGWTNKEPNLKRTVQVRFRRPSWSEYAVLANDFMRFGQGTEVFGKIHSNKGIRFDGLGHNIVSSLMTTFDDPDHSGGNEFGVHTHVNIPPSTGVNDYYRPLEAPPNPVQTRSDVFSIGREFPVSEVSFTGVSSDLAFMKTEAQAGHGIYFDDSDYGRHIILKTDGTMDVRTVLNYNTSSNSIISESATTTYAIPNAGVVFVEDNAWVEGTINNKKVTIVGENVYIGMNNILYTNLDGKDIIGIIAQKDIEVIRDSQNFLTIDAALLAQSGRVGRKQYGTWCVSWHKVWWLWVCDDWTTDHRNTITINGSLATNLRYGFAYTDGTGYTNRNLNFDNNLLYYPPPYFPTGSQYSIDLWEEI